MRELSGVAAPHPSTMARPLDSLSARRGDWLLANLRAYRRDKVALLHDAMRDRGDLVLLTIGRQRVLLVSDPAAVVDILVRRPERFRPSVSYRHLEQLIGVGLVTTGGDVWLRHRKALQPLFRVNALSHVAPIVEEVTARYAGRWLRDMPSRVDVYEAMRDLAMEITTTVMFGASPEGGDGAFRTAFDVGHAYVMKRLESALPLVSPVAAWRFAAAKRRLDAHVASMIARARNDESTLVAQMSANGAAFTDAELHDETLTLLLAGFETTAASLTWLLYLLSRHDAARERVAEGDAAYAALVVQESLRLYPPVWAFSRETIVDSDVGGYAVPAGTKIAIAPYCIHRNARFWPDAESFQPERFDRGIAPPPGAYLPFGLGARQCLGRPLALIMLQQVLLTLTARCRLVMSDTLPRYRAGIFLTPRDPLLAVVAPR